MGFDWDDENQNHLKLHKVCPAEFEQVMLNEPVDLEYQRENGEDRYKALGATNLGRVLIVVWTVRRDRMRAVTAYPAPTHLRRAWVELQERGST